MISMRRENRCKVWFFLFLIWFPTVILAIIMTRSQALQELGLKSGPTPQDLKKAYRKRSLETHPDKKGGSHEAFLRVAEAYEVLSKDTAGGRQQRRTHQRNYEPTKEDLQFMFQKAEDMFFDVFEEYIQNGKASDLFIDRMFGGGGDTTKNASSSLMASVKRFCKIVVKWIANQLTEQLLCILGSEIVVHIYGNIYFRSSDFRAWRNHVRERRSKTR